MFTKYQHFCSDITKLKKKLTFLGPFGLIIEFKFFLFIILYIFFSVH